MILIVSFLMFFTNFANLTLGEEASFEKIPVRIIKEIILPKAYHEGLYLDGKNIWVSNGRGYDTWVFDTETGKIISKIKPIGSFTEAISSAGDGTFWMTDWNEKKLYRVKIEEGRMEAVDSVSLELARPAGVVWTGEYLYLITWTRGAGGTSYHLLQFDSAGKILRKMRIKHIPEPAHLAWDDKNLWITSWYNQRVYKIDEKTFQVLDSFQSPAAKTTGIAWDGRHFWITGTHANLYQTAVGEFDESHVV
ncbi:MAG: hypothetical protein ABH844_02600 [Candidatus Omnitrophota bacterium]